MIPAVAERVVLGRLLIGPPGKAIETREGGLFPEDFSNPVLGKAYRAIVDAAYAGRSVYSAVVEGVPEIARELGDLVVEVPSHVTLQDAVDILQRGAAIRRVTEIAASVQDIAKADPEAAVEVARHALDALPARRRRRPLSPTEEWEEIRREARERRSQVIGVPTGYHWLDELTLGFWPGWTVIVGGATSGGKSAFATGFYWRQVRDLRPGLIVSTEMSRRTTLLRIAAWDTGIPTMRLLRETEAVYPIFAATEESGVEIVDDLRALPDVARECRRAVARGAQWIAIDFVQNIQVRGAVSIFDRMSAVAIELQRLAIELSVPFLLVSQLSNAKAREGSGGPVELRGAGELAHAADLVLMLDRPDATRRAETDLSVQKFRHGPAGNCYALRFSDGYTRLEVRNV